mmetsp:Transcript_29047/g.46652  ORF Transcript_29047/g.46652 Transcript_29047/m.46652 type:complete len:466 (+) Transcript_29047:79-1476(+)
MYLHQTRHRRSTTKRGCSNQAFNLNLILLGAALLCFSVGEERCSYCNGNPSRIVSSMIPMKRMATMQYDPHPGSVEKEFPLPRPSEPTEIGYQRIYSGELPMAEFTYSVDTNASDSATSALFTGDPLPENPFSYYPGGSISDEGGKLKIPIDSEESIQGADLYKVMDNRHIPRRSPYYNLCYQEMFEDSSDADDDDDDDATKTGFVNVTTTAVQRRHLIDRKHYLEQNKRNFEEIKQIAFIRKLNESQMKFLTNTYLRHFALGYDALTSKSTQILTARLKLSTSQLENCTAFYKKQYEYLLMALGDDNDMGSSSSKKSKEKGDHDQLHQIQTIEQGIGQGEIADITHQGKQQKKREDEKEEEEKQKNDHSSSAGGGGGETLADALISRAGGNLDLEPPPPPQGANLSDIKVLKKYYSLESSSMENDDYLQTGYRTYDDKFHGLFPSPTACAHEVEVSSSGSRSKR